MIDKTKEARKYFTKPKNILILVIVILALIGIVVSLYFIITYNPLCKDEVCFSDSIVKCKKITYISETPETITEYKIIGKEKNECEINVKLLQIKQGSAELSTLESEEMICSVPLGVYEKPESNIRNCHGILKEKIQEIMIQRMHSQIVENLGEINEEITKII